MIYLINIGAWCLFTLAFDIYNIVTDLPRGTWHKYVAYGWMAWSLLTLISIILHFR